MAPRKAIKKVPIKPPSGIKHKAPAKRVMKRKGGMIPMAIAAPLLGALGAPIANALGQQGVRLGKYAVGKIRKAIGLGVIRSGSSRMQGGQTRRIVVRV